MTHLPEKQKRRNKRWVCINVPSVEELAGIPDDEIMKSTLPKGYYLWILAPDMRTIYAVLSEHVRLTRGVLDYLYDYVRWGPNKIHNKLFLCPSYNQRKCCDNGFLCREVHSDFSTDTAVEATAYNVFSNANGCLTSAERKENKGLPPPPNVMLWHSLHSRWTPASAYPTLPSGIPFRVAIPNSPKPFEEFDSGRLFATKVAREHYNRLSRNEPPTVTLQHCANFSKNGVCCFGQNCQFVHVVHYSGERSGDDDSLHDVSPGSMQCNSNGNSKNNNNNDNDNDNNDNNSQGAMLPPKLNTTSFSESFGDASRTSFPLMHFSLPPSPCASLNGPQRFQNTQSGSSENGLTNTQTLALSPSALQAGLLPQHRDQFQQRQQQFQVPPPAQQKHQQQHHHHHHHQQQQQRQILQSSLSTGSLTRLNPPNQPLFFLQGSPQPQMPMHPMYTVMLSPPDCHMNGVSPLYVVPY